MEDRRSQDVNTTSRRSRRTVFKGPIRGFIHHAGGRGDVVAYNESTDMGDGDLHFHSWGSLADGNPNKPGVALRQESAMSRVICCPDTKHEPVMQTHAFMMVNVVFVVGELQSRKFQCK
jgi:hypothetical protein